MQPSEIKAPPLPYSKVQDFFLDRFLKKITHKRLFGTQRKAPYLSPKVFQKTMGDTDGRPPSFASILFRQKNPYLLYISLFRKTTDLLYIDFLLQHLLQFHLVLNHPLTTNQRDQTCSRNSFFRFQHGENII